MRPQNAHLRAIPTGEMPVIMGFSGEFDDQSDDQSELMTS
jgi:hypothetical protein